VVDLNTLNNFGLIVACADDAAVANTYRAASKHYIITPGQNRSHTLGPGAYGPATKKLTITAGADTVYLPFWQNNISSVALPTAGPTVFITDNMSGCCLYLGAKADGSLVAFHANSELKSSKADLEGQAANFQHKDTLQALDTLSKVAKAEANVVRIVGGCGKGMYNAGIAKTGGAWLGGTTIVGFRTGTGWEFYFQTWGSLGGGAVQVHQVKKFYPA
jgi:hypothetical protein